ncbi:MAG: sigma-54 dependent transcriptional regulator [Planctomycetota bacterium]|jgi:DNA-binding NtrC family response regulator|nr:sigma-54 dependent transcriptional regulator [Planctomycetota bacterium]
MENNPLILVVDDNENVYKSLLLNFRQEGFSCLWAADSGQTLAAVGSGRVSAVLMDLSLGREDGIEIMREVFRLRPGLPVIIITGYGTFEAAVRAIKLGAFDFLAKPLEFDRLLEVIGKAVRFSTPSGADPAREGGDEPDPRLFTRDPAMLELCRKARRLAATDIPVLVTGESGTGKELLAELIHRHSGRRDRAFIRVNCSAIAETLIDDELFGHERGAFTGAVQAKPGLFEQADGGTLHLDEIGDMNPATQAKILRTLENGRLRRVGGIQDVPVDVRIIASTNRNLHELIERGRFRRDLFYRLNSVLLHLPPLRERTGDILPLARLFLDEFMAGDSPRRLAPETESRLAAHAWPGNVRELRNAVKVATIISDSDPIGPEALPEQFQAGDRARPAPGRLDAAEAELIRRTLRDSRGNKRKASERLGISRRTLYNKLERYGID